MATESTTQNCTAQDTAWADLMSRAQAGDQKAYTRLLGEIAVVIERFVMSKAGYLGLTADIVQDCLISIHRARQTYDPERPFSTWMFAIVRRRLIDYYRRHTRIRGREVYDEDLLFELRAEDPPEVSDSILRLRRAMQGLSEKYRVPIELTKLEGLSIVDAAEKLQLTESALKVRISRGYKMLKKKLERMPDER